MKINGKTLEVYWDDLTEKAQKDFMNFYGKFDNGNFDIFPFMTFEKGDEEE